MVNQRLLNIQQYLFPGRCELCEARIPTEQDFCNKCKQSLPRPSNTCGVCGANLPEAEIGAVCGICQQHPPAYQTVVSALAYDEPISKLIIDLKYHRKLYLARILGSLLADTVRKKKSELPDLIVPVPLHTSRLRSRGYNQALEIAKPVGRRLGIPVDPRIVLRIRKTPSQTDLPSKDRAKNVRGAFEVRRNVDGLSVAIVDDVMTTGHTAYSVAKSLLEAKAKSVSVWVVARA